jgi:hypothetical protein
MGMETSGGWKDALPTPRELATQSRLGERGDDRHG